MSSAQQGMPVQTPAPAVSYICGDCGHEVSSVDSCVFQRAMIAAEGVLSIWWLLFIVGTCAVAAIKRMQLQCCGDARLDCPSNSYCRYGQRAVRERCMRLLMLVWASRAGIDKRGWCAMQNLLRTSDVIQCRECGYRILYKKRTKLIVQFEAR